MVWRDPCLSGMHMAMALFTEGDKIFCRIISPVPVPVVDVEIFFSTANPAAVVVAFENMFPEFFPFLQSYW